MVGAHEGDVAYALPQQLDTAKNESAHQNLAQLRVCLHQAKDVFAAEFDHLARLTRANSRERATSRERVDLTGELTRAKKR